MDTPYPVRYWPPLLDDHDASFEADSVLAEPFAAGDRVYLLDHPELGSRIVTKIERHPMGGWLLHYRSTGDDGGYGFGPAEHYALVPEGWSEPPAQPGPTVLMGLSDYGRRSDLVAEDPEYHERMTAWQEAMLAWLAGIGEGGR